MKIDAHQHFWSLQRPNDYGFLTPEAGVLYQTYLPNDLEPLLQQCGFDYSIVVQAAESKEETDWLFEIVRDQPFVAGVIGWTDMDASPDVFKRELKQLQEHEKFLGLRPMLQSLDDERFIVRPNVLQNLTYLAELDIPFELLVYPKHLEYVYEMLQEVPGLRAVINHLAKPLIRNRETEPWLTWIERLGRFPNLWCKISGMVTEADHANWKYADFVPYIRGAISSFGPDRLIFGSDWPVCLLAASYNEVVDLVGQLTAEHFQSSVYEDAIFGGNAISFYKLNLHKRSIY